MMIRQFIFALALAPAAFGQAIHTTTIIPDGSGPGEINFREPLATGSAAVALKHTALASTHGQVDLVAADTYSTVFAPTSYGTGTISGLILRSGRGTASAPSVTLANDAIGRITFSGYTGAVWTNTAYIQAEAQDLYSGNVGVDLSFALVPSGSTTRAEKMRLYGSGKLMTVGDIVPSTGGGAQVLGDAGKEWTARLQNLYIAGNLQNDFVPAATNTLSLGGTSNRYKKTWTVDLDVSGTCTGCTDSSKLPLAGGTMTGNILWSADNTYGIGAAATRASAVYSAISDTRKLELATANSANGNGFWYFQAQVISGNESSVVLTDSSGSAAIKFWRSNTSGVAVNYANLSMYLYPTTDYGYDIGSTTQRWSNVYARGAFQVYSDGSPNWLAASYSATLSLYDSGGTRTIYGSNTAGTIDVTTGYKVNGTAGTGATLTCAAGQAVKNITVSGGIVTAVSCGAP